MAAIVARLTRRRRQREALSAEYDYETSKVIGLNKLIFNEINCCYFLVYV